MEQRCMDNADWKAGKSVKSFDKLNQSSRQRAPARRRVTDGIQAQTEFLDS